MKNRIKEIVGALSDTQDALKNLSGKLDNGPASFYFKVLNEYIEGLFSFAKFKVGDIVILAKDVDCSKAPGWQGSKHFLKYGRSAEVTDIDWRDSRFVYHVIFHSETWLDDKGVERPVTNKHTFLLPETQFARVEPQIAPVD